MYPVERWAYANRLGRRHPAEKLALAGGMLLLSLTLPAYPGAMLIAGVMAVAAVGVAGISPAAYLRMLRVPAGFVLAGAAAMAVSVAPGRDGWHVALSPEGVAVAASTALRSLAAVCSMSFLALTTPVAELVGLARRWPRLGTAAEVALLVHRFLNVLAGTLTAMRVAQESRLGYASPRQAYRSLAALAACLLPRALDRAHRLERGLAARGYQGGLPVLPSARRPLSFAALAGILALELVVAALGACLGGRGAWPM